MGIAFRIAAIAASIIVMAGVALPAVAGERRVELRPVAAARLGVIGSRTPRMGPVLVRRGGFTAIKDMVRPRFVGGMIDIYPSSKNGFRLSVGDRYFSSTNFWRDAEQATHGLLFDARMVRFGIGVQQRVYRKRTPAALIGYDTELAPGLVAGIEGGTLLGRAINRGPRLRMSSGGDRGINRSGLNPIATFAVRYAF